jgi:hypothetical protein
MFKQTVNGLLEVGRPDLNVLEFDALEHSGKSCDQ